MSVSRQRTVLAIIDDLERNVCISVLHTSKTIARKSFNFASQVTRDTARGFLSAPLKDQLATTCVLAAMARPDDPVWGLMSLGAGAIMYGANTKTGQYALSVAKSEFDKQLAKGVVYTGLVLVGEGFYLASGAEHGSVFQMFAALSAAMALPASKGWLTKGYHPGRDQKYVLGFMLASAMFYVGVGSGTEDELRQIITDSAEWVDVTMHSEMHLNISEITTGVLIGLSAAIKMWGQDQDDMKRKISDVLAAGIYSASGVTLMSATLDGYFQTDDWDTKKSIAAFTFILAGMALAGMKKERPLSIKYEDGKPVIQEWEDPKM